MPDYSHEFANLTSSDPPVLKIAGFGACMISGYPHKNGGLFEVARRFVEQNLSQEVQSHIISLAGFTAPRAKKYLKRRVFKFEPDYIVIQFGSSDVQSFFRVQNSQMYEAFRSKVVLSNTYAIPRAPTLLSRARSEISSLKGLLLGADPVTPLSSYISAIRTMADDCTSHRIVPVVPSPFVFGRRHSMKNAILYTNALHELHARVQSMIFVDCVDLLSKFPKSKMLLDNGSHISIAAHNLVGEAIGQAIVEDVIRTRPAVERQPERSV